MPEAFRTVVARRSRVRELWEKILVWEDVRAGAYHPSMAGSRTGLQGLSLSEEERLEVRRRAKS